MKTTSDQNHRELEAMFVHSLECRWKRMTPRRNRAILRFDQRPERERSQIVTPPQDPESDSVFLDGAGIATRTSPHDILDVALSVRRDSSRQPSPATIPMIDHWVARCRNSNPTCTGLNLLLFSARGWTRQARQTLGSRNLGPHTSVILLAPHPQLRWSIWTGGVSPASSVLDLLLPDSHSQRVDRLVSWIENHDALEQPGARLHLPSVCSKEGVLATDLESATRRVSGPLYYVTTIDDSTYLVRRRWGNSLPRNPWNPDHP